ncbi:drug/metabolite transporter (DMT)-like permease [Bacillus ectoiniformans]|uniref:multidrug resistance efflux transporter family protein n=1 Tax=Bacillus ectoiniformans TaxID=1494429 RepID=UPI00195B9ADC|nr:drug/metabolite transporter (DMT)-like permease [Bacillus ectoiniformans]
MKEILIGILASMFFAVTFILNRSMELSGGSWMWSSSLRFFFMLPPLFLILLLRRRTMPVIKAIAKQPIQWFGWSFVGFVLFYAPLTFAAAYGPGWLIASTWQLTIVAGVLLGPLFYETIQTKNGLAEVRQQVSIKALFFSFLIFIGVVLIQWQEAQELTIQLLLASVLPVVIAAFAYPLGNRKMMEVCNEDLDTLQRVFGMTLASLPSWLTLSGIAFFKEGAPASDQILQSFIVAICSGVIATTLFFIATNRVRQQKERLAAVEATQSTQVLFVILGEFFLLSSPLPTGISLLGLAIVIVGMILHSFNSKKKPANQPQVSTQELKI